ncbi:MAG TPA: diguanylate cyclase [Conexibacter sp.]|nr:diguanylate cyclase [Conexibacter sp.]
MTDSAPPAPPRPRRPQPVASTIAEPLAGRAQAVAKGWLLVLLERAPLASVGAIPAAALAADGPAICAALARALGSDAELARLGADGDLAALAQRIGPLAAATDAGAIVGAVDALRACIWTAALELLGERAETTAVAALAERLAEVAALVTATALGSAAVAPPHADAEVGVGAAAADPEVHDLRDMAPLGELPPRPAVDPRSGPAAAMDDSDLWIATLERHVDRCQREGGGLALLRVELVDGERIVASAEPEERGVPYGRLAQAVRRAIRRQDLVAADHNGRAWVIAPAVGRAGAIALAERIGAGVENGEPWHGAPLAATIGFAVYGEDGQDAATLIERAEEAMLAASAAGVRIGESIPPSDDAGRPGPRLVR